MNIKNQRGFSILEACLALLIVMGTTSIIIDQINYYTSLKKATIYADQTKGYAKAFTRMLTDNYAQYYTNTQSNPSLIQVIPVSTLKSAGYLPTGVSTTNIYLQSPCAIIQLNGQSNQLQAIMIYGMNTSTTNTLTRNLGWRAATSAGGEFGVVESDLSVSGTGKGWSLPASSSLLSAISNCDLKTLPRNSLVVNLSMLPEFSQNLESDPTLHRVKDTTSSTNPGDPNNANTMQTDIVMQSKSGSTSQTSGIYLSGTSGSNGVFLGSGVSKSLNASYQGHYKADDVIVAGGNIAANTIKPLQAVNQFDSCPHNSQYDDVGKIAADASNKGYIKQHLICTYNPYYCGNAPNKSCYLPINSVTIQFHPNSTNGFDCSQTAGTGFYVVPNSATYQTNNSNIQPDKSWCSLQWGDVKTDGTYGSWTSAYSSNGMTYAIYPMQHYEWVGCSWGSCCSFNGERSPVITSISCTNDTSTFSTQGS